MSSRFNPKHIHSFSENRSKREERIMNIRKEKLDDTFFKKRNLVLSNTNETMDTTSGAEILKDIKQIAEALNSNDLERIKIGVISVRKLLSTERNPPIDQVINANIVPRIVELLNHDNNKIQFEAAWALTNVASGTTDQTQYVVSCGAIPIFIKLLLSPFPDVCDQAIWALGNIAGDGPACRDAVLKQNILEPLFQIISNCLKNTQEHITVLRNAIWTLSNLCRGKPQPEFEMIKPILQYIPYILNVPDHDVVVDAFWAISHISDSDQALDSVIHTPELLSKLVLAIYNPDHLIVTPALRSLGNIVTGSNEQTQAVIDARSPDGKTIFEALKNLLHNQKKNIQKEACWMISNLTAGTVEQITSVISSGLFNEIIGVMDSSAAFDVKKEACWSLCNAAVNGNEEQIRYLVDMHAIERLCLFLDCSDAKVVVAVLDALLKILKMYQMENGDNKIADLLEEKEYLSKLEDLQQHPSDIVYQKVMELLETYFNANDEEDMEDNPQMVFDPNANNQNFSFNGFN